MRSDGAYLPEELYGTNEGGGVLELPTDDVGPLVETERKITMTTNPTSVSGVHDGLGGGTDGDGLREIAGAALGDPGDLRAGGGTRNILRGQNPRHAPFLFQELPWRRREGSRRSTDGEERRGRTLTPLFLNFSFMKSWMNSQIW